MEEISLNNIYKEFKKKQIPIKNFKKQIISIFVRLIRFTVIAGICFVVLYPLLIDFSIIFRQERDFYDPSVIFVPKNFTLENITLVINAMNFIKAGVNSFTISIAVSICQIISCALVGYGLAKFRFKGNNIVFACVVLTLIVPSQIIISPLFLQFSSYNPLAFLGIEGGINLNNTVWPILFMSITGIGFRNGIYIYLFRQFFKGVPKSLDEAAMIDGANRFKVFYSIAIPSSRPIMITVFLFSFVWSWTDVMFSGTFMYNTQLLSINAGNIQSLILSGISGLAENKVLTAIYIKTASVILIAPLLFLYIFLQRYFTQSIERTGLVG